MQRHSQIIIISGIILTFLVIFVGILIAHDIAENRRLDATSVTLKSEDYLTVPFDMDAKVSDFIENLEGSMVDDFTISTNTLGEQEVTFEYINIKNRRRKYHFTITVADVTPPRIFGNSYYTVTKGTDIDLTSLMLSGDDLDDHPVREILGNYNLQQVGTYALEYRITDASGNSTSQPFTLAVVEPKPSSSTSTPSTTATGTPIAKIIQQYKTPQTKIGIDVSSWQGNVDWAAAKASGVEFAILRLGYGYDENYVIDTKFQANITGALAAGLPVGVYFYSYADSVARAQAQAEWVYEQVKDYQLELGVTFDWEDWGDFNQYGMSFYTLNQTARSFLDFFTDRGYLASLYGSKYYLERFWEPAHPVWVAQYYDENTYDGEYWLWQLTDSGQVGGISGLVDIDIMYLENKT